ncbi:MAG: alginate O-acetyltransferase AlgX-related protein [Verrucomicrobiales bacterium]
MMRAFARPGLFSLASLLVAGLTACQLFPPTKEDKAAKPDEAAVVPSQSGLTAAPHTKPENSDLGPDALTAAQEEVPPASPAPSDSAALAGLPKGEAEFILACRAAAETERPAVEGRKGFLFSRDSLREVGANRTAQSIRHRMLVGTISAYAARLKAAGAEFVLVPVPPKEMVYPDRLPGARAVKDGRFDSYLQSLYSDLKRSGVRVVDMTKELRGSRSDGYGDAFPKLDFNWSPRAAELAARRLYKELKRSAKTIARDKSITSSTDTITAAGQSLRARTVGTKSGKGIAALPAPMPGTAPIVLVCDANGLVYHFPNLPRGFKGEPKAGLPDQLAREFGAPVEVRGEAGLRWKSASSRFTPGSSEAAKLVVWCFSAVDFLKDGAPATLSPPRENEGGRRVAASRPTPAPRPASSRRPPGSRSTGGLRLRDDPGVDVRAQ